jgi:hypothetical protein
VLVVVMIETFFIILKVAVVAHSRDLGTEATKAEVPQITEIPILGLS